MRKKIARFLGHKIPYFKGKDKIIRFLYSPNRNLNSGEIFTTDYFGKKYQGETGNYIDWGVYFKGGLEKGLVNYIKTQINEFKYFLDVGANSGTVSLPFCDIKKLKIICFEPLTYSYLKLINNYKINNSFEKHSFHKIGLSNINQTSKIYFSDNDSNIGTASLDEKQEKTFNKFEEIKLSRLDDIYNFKNEKIFIKIDIQGHEDKFLEGAIEMLKNNKILMYLETSNEKLLKKLEKMNYKVYFPKFLEGDYKFQKFRSSEDVILKNFS